MNFLTLLNNFCLNLLELSTWKCMKQKSTTPNSPAINWCYWYVLLVFSIPLFPAFDLRVIFDYMCEKWMLLKIIICKTFQILPKNTNHNVFFKYLNRSPLSGLWLNLSSSRNWSIFNFFQKITVLLFFMWFKRSYHQCFCLSINFYICHKNLPKGLKRGLYYPNSPPKKEILAILW